MKLTIQDNENIISITEITEELKQILSSNLGTINLVKKKDDEVILKIKIYKENEECLARIYQV